MIKIVKIMTQNVTCNIDLFFNFATEKKTEVLLMEIIS